MAGKKIAPERRFWKYVQKSDGCWEWTGYRMPRGFGHFNAERGESRLAHRYAYRLLVGPIPEGLNVCHHCDNPPCVRPDHLFLGTQKDNMEDAVAKGRQAKGLTITLSRGGLTRKLEPEQILEIQEAILTAPKMPLGTGRGNRMGRPPGLMRGLAVRYGVTEQQIRIIGRGLAWPEVE